MEVVQYIVGITLVQLGITSVDVGIAEVLWRVFSAGKGQLQYCG